MGLTSKALFFIFAVGVGTAHANSISFDFAHGADFESSTFAGDGDFRKYKDTETSYDWNGSFTKAKVNTQDQNGNSVVDNSYTFLGGLGLETPSKFVFSGDFTYSVTPEQAIVSLGPSVTFGYSYLGKAESAEGQLADELSLEENNSPFRSKLTFKINFSALTYEERFGAETRKPAGTGARPTTGMNSIVQRGVGGSIAYKPWSWGRLKISLNNYSYSKDVNEFLQYLDAQPRRAAGLSEAISGFAKSESSVEFDFYVGHDWELDVSDKRSKIVSDNSTSKTDKFMIYYEATDSWRIGLGGQRSESDVSSATASSTVANEGLFSLSYDF